jgi:hypothetical protein
MTQAKTTAKSKAKARQGYIYSTGIINDDLLYTVFIEYSMHFFIENDAEILQANYNWKVAFTNLFHKQSIQVKL